MQRLFYLIQKEFRQIRRVRAYIGLIFVMPIAQLLLLGFAITVDVKNLPLAVVDEDHSAASRRIIESFSNSELFDYKGETTSAEKATQLLDANLIKSVIIIPQYFERDLKNLKIPQLQVLFDGVDGNSTGIAMAYIQQSAMLLQKEWLKGYPPSMMKAKVVEILPRMWYNPNLDSKYNIVPGILAVLITMITAFLTAMNLVREKEIGTLEQLMVTPIKSWELILGKVLPFLVVAIMILIVGILAAGIVFGIWVKGSITLLFFMSVIFSMSTLGLGIFASTMAQTQQQAMFVAYFFSIFTMLLSGFFIPIENMPSWVQIITYLNPMRYYIVIIREIYLKGSGFIHLWREALAMTIFGAMMISLASLRLRKRLS
jgi:ABC-2 type transport system permease protein